MTSSSLEEVAAAADQVAADQKAIARQARAMKRQRERGWSWSRVLERQPSPDIVALLRSSRRQLGSATAAFVSMLAAALAEEGETRRQIAARLGVTHQRVSALLRGNGQSQSG